MPRPGLCSITAVPLRTGLQGERRCYIHPDEMPGFDRSALQKVLESMNTGWLCEISDEAHMVEASSPVVG
jgi:hypothetical protein